MTFQSGKVTYIFPFYWGFFVDISKVLSEGYRTTQELLVEKLNGAEGKGWYIEDKKIDDRLWHMKEKKVYGGSTKLGTSFLVRRITPGKEISYDILKLRIDEIRFFYHEFGTATVRIVTNFQTLNHPITYQQLEDKTRSREVVNSISAFVNPIIKADCEYLTSAFLKINIPIAIDSEYFSELISSESIKASYSRTLWEHLIYEVKLEQDSVITGADIEPYKALINSSRLDGAMEASLDDHVHLYPGFGTSLIVTNRNSKPEDTNLVRTVEIAEYYYAATALLDDLLYDKFITFSLHNVGSPKIPTIQKDMEEIKTLSNLLEVFLFVLKDSLINFNAHAKIIWKVYEREWYYSPMLESLEDKSHILNEKYVNLLNELNEKRSQSLNRLVKIFTVFAILGPTLEFYQFAEDRNLIEAVLGLDPIILFATGGVILLLLLGVGGYLLRLFRKFY